MSIVHMAYNKLPWYQRFILSSPFSPSSSSSSPVSSSSSSSSLQNSPGASLASQEVDLSHSSCSKGLKDKNTILLQKDSNIMIVTLIVLPNSSWSWGLKKYHKGWYMQCWLWKLKRPERWKQCWLHEDDNNGCDINGGLNKKSITKGWWWW